MDQDLFRTRTSSARTESAGEACPVRECLIAATEVRCAALEVVRARDATHSAIALRSAESAGEMEARNSIKELQCVGTGVWPQFAKQKRLVDRRHSCGLSNW